MDTKPFKPLYDGDGPFSSAYLPTPGNEADAAHRIELTWRELREDLAGQGAPEADLRAIDEAVGEAVGRPGASPAAAVGGTRLAARAGGLRVAGHRRARPRAVRAPRRAACHVRGSSGGEPAGPERRRRSDPPPRLRDLRIRRRRQ
jgi:hypothetical protein